MTTEPSAVAEQASGPLATPSEPRIARMFVYPIKSCAGIEVNEAVLTETGLDLDRAWMLVDEQGEFVSQRELPRMCLIQPKFRVSDMVLRAPGMLPLHLALDAAEQPTKVRVWNDEVAAYDMGAQAAQWFSDFLGTKLRLARFDPEFQRLSAMQWTGGVAAPNQFSDGFPLLVLSEAALPGLNERLSAQGQASVGIERFRPNLVLSGLAAHGEDKLTTLQVETAEGAAELRLVKPCSRCSIPDIDPATASTGSGVTKALMGYRRDARVNGAITFGMNAIVASGADLVLRVGQSVRVT